MKFARSKQLVGCLIAVLLVALALLGGEIALRNGFPATEHYERWMPSPEGGGPKLLILGDSFFTRLAGREDIHDHLYPRLASRGMQVLNPSRPGIGPQEYLRLFVDAAETFRPDVILVSHYVGNDLLDVGCSVEIEQLLEDAMRPRDEGVGLSGSLLLRYLEGMARSHTMHHPDFDWAALEARNIPPEDIEKAKHFEVNPWVIGMGETRPSYYRETLFVDSDCARRAWENTVLILDEILRRADALDAVVVPVVFPHTLQVNELHHGLYASWQIEVDASMMTSRRPQELLEQYYAARGIEMLDLLPAFKAAAEPLYWEADEHLAPAGQALAAAEIASFLAVGKITSTTARPGL